MDTRDAATGRMAPHGEAVPDSGPLDMTALELAALRERLRAVEAALDLPARPGRPTPPSLRVLLARVAALERRVGLAPLPGHDGIAKLIADPATPASSRRPGWRERGPGLLATALALALCAWLLRPLPGHVAPAPAPVVAALATVAPPVAVTPDRVRAAPPAAPTAAWPPCDHATDAGWPWNAAVLAAPAASPTVPWLRCDATVGGFCAADAQGPAPPTPGPGESPRPRGGAAPCRVGGASAATSATPCIAVDDPALPRPGCAGAPPTAPLEPCPLPDERVCVAER